MVKNNYPYQDVEDNLNQAQILEIKPIFDDENDLDDEEGKTLHSKRSSSSRTSRLSKRSKSKRSATSKTCKHKSSASKGKSKTSERAKSRNQYKKGLNTKTDLAQDYKNKKEYYLDAIYVLKKMLEISLKTMNVI